MSLGRVAAWAGYEPAIVDALPQAAQRRLAAIGVATPVAAILVGFGARRWMLDAQAGAPAALAALVAVAALTVWTSRLLVAGGGMPARDAAEAGANPGDIAPVVVPPRYRPAWLAPLWQLWAAALWLLPLAAHASVELRLEPAAWPRGVVGWLGAASAAPTTLVAWLVGFAALGAGPALLALVSRGARIAHARARAARDRALIVALHHQHRRGVVLALRRAGAGLVELAPEACLDPPFDTRPGPAPWREAPAVEVPHLRWLLARQAAQRPPSAS